MAGACRSSAHRRTAPPTPGLPKSAKCRMPSAERWMPLKLLCTLCSACPNRGQLHAECRMQNAECRMPGPETIQGQPPGAKLWPAPLPSSEQRQRECKV